MKKIIIFIVVAGIILAGGFYVNQRIDQQIEQEAARQAESSAAELAKKMEGFEKKDLREGTGREAQVGDTVTVNYRGWLTESGKEFDSSYKNGQPISLTLGAGQVIEGWELGLLGMKEGGKRQLIIPPALAYGEAGRAGVIPPNATLGFEVELVKIQ